MLNPAELQSYRRDGYIVRPGLFSAREVGDFRAWIETTLERELRPGKEMLYFEDSLCEPGKRILSRMEKFADPGEPFAQIVRGRRLLDVVDALIAGPAVLFKEKINFKLPGGGGFEPHQDMQAGWSEYAPNFISVAVALDENSVGNGCLELAPGQHTRGLLGELWKPLSPSQLAGVRFVACPMAPGDAAFFDGFVPHHSKPNLTALPRRTLYLTYNLATDGDHRTRYFADKRASYPPDNEREPARSYVYRV